MDYIKEKLYQQLAIDYCCQVSDIKDAKNHFTEYEKLKGRRQFEEAADCVLKVIAVNGKLIFTGKKSIIEVCRKQFSNNSGNWFMDASNFRKLDEILMNDGYRVKTAHPFFIPKDDCVHEINGVKIKKYNQEEILQFKDDDRFDEAFCFSEESPDVLAVAAIIDDEIVGMAGASADILLRELYQYLRQTSYTKESCHIMGQVFPILRHSMSLRKLDLRWRGWN